MKRSVIVLMHSCYWLIYLLLLAVLQLLLWAGRAPDITTIAWGNLSLFMTGFAIIPALIGFYLFYTVLFSGLLKQKRLILFTAAALGVSVGAGLAGAVATTFLSSRFLSHGLFASGAGSAIPLTGIMAFNALLNGSIGLVMRGFISWYGDIRLKEELNRKHFETELALVKSQINPHFLFNTINNIDVLIGKDPVKASQYLNQLSDMMRFMLYETKAEIVPLSKELLYIEKYVALQKIRTANTNYVHYHVEGVTAAYQVAPMLFIPFIENAFKHAADRKQDHAINISIAADKDRILFHCDNKYPQVRPAATEAGGLGNELIRKRLQLLYPGRHQLDIKDQDQVYSVTLMINNHAY